MSKARLLCTIGPEHRGPGKSLVRMGDRRYNLNDALGYVQEIDYGKRAYVVDGIVQVENNEQRDKRLGLCGCGCHRLRRSQEGSCRRCEDNHKEETS